MTVAQLTELRLDAFKSFHGATLPLQGVSILIGRNFSGKSNALDGLEVLARLASGEDLRDALDGRRREGGPVRGGSSGCAPHGADRFSLGCRVEAGADVYDYSVTVAVRPDLRIVEERLEGTATAVNSGKISPGVLFHATTPDDQEPGLLVEVHNGKQGPNESVRLRDNKLVLAQVPLAVPAKNSAELSVLRGAGAVISALRGVFHLDPIPHLMRAFVPERDAELRRTGANVSAALNQLQRADPASFNRIEGLLRTIADERVHGVTFVRSDLGDVMLALREVRGENSREELTPAREMSDGLLRFSAIATALLTMEHGLDLDEQPGSASGAEAPAELRGGVLVVLEELENGLYPAQARPVLDLVGHSVHEPRTNVLVTTHSAALLNATEGTLVDRVVVCHRDLDTGFSALTRLVDMPGYAVAMAQHSLGDAVAAGELAGVETPDLDLSEFEELLGIK